MSTNIRNTTLTAVLSCIIFACIFGTRPLVPLLSDQIGASHLQIGLIVAVFAILPALFIVSFGRIIGRFSSRRKMFLTMFVTGIGLTMPYFFPNLPGIYAAQLISGLPYAMYLVVSLEFIENCSDSSTRDRNVMRLSVGNAAGTFIGPMAGGALSDLFSYETTFLILGLTGIASSFITFFLSRGEEPPKAKLKPSGTALGLLALPNFRRAIYISVLVLLAKDMYTAYFPLLGNDFGFTTTIIGLAVSINSLAGIFVRLFMPNLIEKFGRDWVLIGSFLLSALFFAAIPLFSQISVQFAISFVLGLGLGIGQPLSMSETLLALPKERLSDGLGLRISMNRASQAATPVLFGGLSHLVGLSGIFWGVGLVILAGVYAIGFRERNGT